MTIDEKRFVNRDLSWLSFNSRILDEAAKVEVPLLERLKFLAIYSSNLDEFYRVRIPVLMALKELKKKKVIGKSLNKKGILKRAKKMIDQQQSYFGHVLEYSIIPALKKENIFLQYCEPIPEYLKKQSKEYFFCNIAAYMEIIYPEKQSFFPKNNQLYLAVTLVEGDKTKIAILNIPSNHMSRFFCTNILGKRYIIFIDDIIKDNLQYIFSCQVIHAYSFKITRDADLDLQDEFTGDIAGEIEKQLNVREFGIATRFLYQPAIPEEMLTRLTDLLQLTHTNQMAGGFYHNLSDFFGFPVTRTELQYPKVESHHLPIVQTLFKTIADQDVFISTPYDSYDTVLRFFNEAAINPDVSEVYTTMYRVAPDSRIMYALISAARNGKKVVVFIELKARFDEANNIKWAKILEAVGIRIIYSTPKLKVHAKIALVKLKTAGENSLLGLLSTGNFNERTASVYTDHTLITANPVLTKELDALFSYLNSEEFGKLFPKIPFSKLLVAQFNLLPAFIQLIDREINHAKQGKPAFITIKLNHLEEETLIDKLYEASQAGVEIRLIVRSICRLRPGVNGLSERIQVRRIVDRYLEHGRTFIFHNLGAEIFLGSADWMDRNIYRRIEVCFPILEARLKQQIKEMIALQLSDDLAAVTLDRNAQNVAIKPVQNIRSQHMMYPLIHQHLIQL